MEQKINAPSMAPCGYKTESGLLRAVEKLLASKTLRAGGQSRGMWLTNAEWCVRENFGEEAHKKVLELRKKYSISRRQDLRGGDSVFGVPLQKRGYAVGDNIPGVGEISEIVETGNGRQFNISGQWYAERCFENA